MTHRWGDVACFDGLYNGIMTVCQEEECLSCGKKRRVPENARPFDNSECIAKPKVRVAIDHPLQTFHKDKEVLSGDEMRNLQRKSHFLDRSKRNRTQSLQ